AQGGTWAQVHLLGTPALDRHRAYVGQSRGQLATHTWNTKAEGDHPLGLLADDRSPSAAVLDAMRRDEPKTLAAIDDPNVVDRTLRAERAEHLAVVRDRPADYAHHLELGRARRARAIEEEQSAQRSLVHYEHERARLGPLTRLRRGGRDDIAQHDERVARAHDRLTAADHALCQARADVARAEAGAAARAAWDAQHGWRVARLAEIDAALARHWAEVTLRAVRADDPLAFGIEHLRSARATW